MIPARFTNRKLPGVATCLAVLASCLALAGCGTLPQPFLGKPGHEGQILSVPPPPELVVPPPQQAMLDDQAAKTYAKLLAADLVKRDVPTVDTKATPTDWRLLTTASLSGSDVIPHFRIIGPNGHVYDHLDGAPVSASAWANGDQATLATSAESIAAKLSTDLKAINAEVQHSNPASLENRPAHVDFTGVTGAPGDGDHSLALNLRRDLDSAGIVLVKKPADADFVLTGKVKATPHGSGADIVELDWFVKDRRGKTIGRVSQLHELKKSDMVPYWGDVARAAAQQAALGIKQVIVNATPKAPGKAGAQSEQGKPKKPQPGAKPAKG